MDKDKMDKIEILLKLAENAWRDYSTRRSIEWKANFGLWAGLGAFSGFVFQQNTFINWRYSAVVGVLLYLTIGVYIVFWKKEIQSRNTKDLDAAHYYWNAVDKQLETIPPKIRYRKESVNESWRSTHLSQVIITVIFVVLAMLAVLSKTCYALI